MERGAADNLTWWELIIVVLSIYVLGAIVAETFLPLNEETVRLLDEIDMFICFVFIGDWCVRFTKAPSRLAFMKWGWIDLLASIPNLPMFRWGRMIRVIRVLRVLRALRSTKVLVTLLFRNRAKSAFASVALISMLLVIFASIAILNLETAPHSNIKTASDALWWAWVTVTTVGYGDVYPVTVPGRVIGALLMVAGVGLFGTFTGFIASVFLEKEEEKQTAELDVVLEEIRLLREDVARLRRDPQTDLRGQNSVRSLDVPSNHAGPGSVAGAAGAVAPGVGSDG